MPRRRKEPSQGAAVKPQGGLRETILGLLAIRPMSGYDISRSYARALQRVWYVPVSQIYPMLKVMQAERLLDVEVHVQETRPNRKEYRLTEDGWDALAAWIREPAALPFMHHEFIGKLFVLDNIPAEERREFVEDYGERCAVWARELDIIDVKMSAAADGPFGESVHFQRLALEHFRRLVACEAASARELLAKLERDPRKGDAPAAAAGTVQWGGLFDHSLTPGATP